jgi:hypothetical protein
MSNPASHAVVRVRKNDGTDAYSGTFPVDRGVIQGAIDSPWFFIIALECIFRRCDTEGGIDLGETTAAAGTAAATAIEAAAAAPRRGQR